MKVSIELHMLFTGLKVDFNIHILLQVIINKFKISRVTLVGKPLQVKQKYIITVAWKYYEVLLNRLNFTTKGKNNKVISDGFVRK